MLVEVVIINWKRPKNVARIVEAIRNQTAACKITIIDCSQSLPYNLDPTTISKIDTIYTSTTNLGGFNRYIPMGGFNLPYTFFIDDDLLPGSRCVETFLMAAEKIKDFGVLGQVGRTLDMDNIYRPINVALSDTFVETDFIVRAYFVKTKYLHNLLRFKWHLGYFETTMIEDDLLLCGAMKYFESLSCFLIPYNQDIETLVVKEELDSLHSLSSRKDHYLLRTTFVKRLLFFGWLPVKAKCGTTPCL